MKSTPKLQTLKYFQVVFFFILVCSTTEVYSQIVEIKAIYKSKVDGRIISEEEFQSYKGTHTFHKHIRNSKGRDTIIISPPNSNQYTKAVGDFSAFKSLKGKPIKPFHVADIDGNTYNSDALRGKVVVINYWFVACPPCIKEIPDLNNIVNDYAKEEIVFLAFSKDNPDLLCKFLEHTDFNFKIIPNALAEARKNNVSAYPSTLLIDKEGIVRYTGVGLEKNSINNLRHQIRQALK